MRTTYSKVVQILCLSPLLLPCASYALFSYSEDFSTHPAWTTDDPARLRWDSTRQTFHGTQKNWDGTYAYIGLPSFDPNSTWTLSFDLLVHSIGWSSGLTIGLFDNTLISGNGASIDMSSVDRGMSFACFASGGAFAGVLGAWSPDGKWKHAEMHYEANSRTLDLGLFDETGLRLAGFGLRLSQDFSAEVQNLGVSRLHMKGAGTGVDSSATVDYEIDNIVLRTQEPTIPVTDGGLPLSLLAVACLGAEGMRRAMIRA